MFTAAARQRARERHPIGVNHPQAKLNDTSVHIIDILSACGWSNGEIATVFNTARTGIGRIVRRQIWTHVPRREVSDRMREVLGPDRTLDGLIRMTGKTCRLHPKLTDYAVSDDGSVFSRTKRAKNPSGQWVQLKPSATKFGYLRVGNHYVHSLVLETFVGPCPPGMQCRHFPDRDPTNNHLSNLCWGSPTENSLDRWDQGTMPYGHLHGMAKLTELHIPAIDCLVADGWSRADIAMAFNISSGAVRNIRCRTTWKHVPNRGRDLLAQVSRALAEPQASEEPYPLFWLLTETIRRNRQPDSLEGECP